MVAPGRGLVSNVDILCVWLAASGELDSSHALTTVERMFGSLQLESWTRMHWCNLGLFRCIHRYTGIDRIPRDMIGRAYMRSCMHPIICINFFRGICSLSSFPLPSESCTNLELQKGTVAPSDHKIQMSEH
jgi:hypothetical protein